jgi:signal transduction histidine kinase
VTTRAAPYAGRGASAVGLAWSVALGSLFAAVVGVWVARAHGLEVPWRALSIPVVWSLPGALIAAARPRAALGWLTLLVAAMFSAVGLIEVWLGADPSGPVLTRALGVWFVDRAGALIVPATTLALVLLPDSRLPDRRWRAPVAAGVALQLLLVAMWSFSKTSAASPEGEWPAPLAALDNPVGFLPAVWAAAADDLVWLLQLPMLLAVAAMVVRFRRGDGLERQRLSLLLLALVVLVAVILAGRALLGRWAELVDVLAVVFLACVLVSAVLRRHLEGVSVVVHHAFVLAVLGALVAGAYVVAVGLLAAAGPDLSRFGAGVVAAVAALAIHPLRSRLQALVDRVMRGDPRDPYRAVARLADSAHRAPSLVEVLDSVAASVAAALRVPEARVTAFGVSVRHRPRVEDAVAAGRTLQVPLVAGDREVGSLVVLPQLGRRFRRDEHRLLEELSRHAGVAIDAVRLAGQVAEHHRALITAREEERRRLGRELHDDLGPTVAGLSMQLGALRPLVHTDPETVVARLATLEETATRALADVRQVAHRLRPPVLDQVGLGRAIGQLAESLDLALEHEVVSPPALPAAVELAAYRIAAEALSNVARHAGTRSVRVDVNVTGDRLELVVADSGRGREDVGSSLGMATMRERAEELGGSLTVRDGESGGTIVRAVLPVAAASAAPTAEEAG